MTIVVDNIAFTNDNPQKGKTINLFDSYTFDEWLEHRNDEAYRKDWANRYERKRRERLEDEKAEKELREKIDSLAEKAIDKAVKKAFEESIEK